jgi:hypothetical protein
MSTREMMHIMQNQVQGIRDEFITVIKDIAHKIDGSRTEPTCFQTMEDIMRNGEAQTNRGHHSNRLNVARDHSEDILADNNENKKNYQSASYKGPEGEYRKPYIPSRENSKSRKNLKYQNMHSHHNSANTSNHRNSLEYTDSRMDGVDVSSSQNSAMNRNYDFIQSVMGKENIGNAHSYYSQTNDANSIIDDTPPCPSCVAKVSKVFLNSFNDSIQKLFRVQKPD